MNISQFASRHIHAILYGTVILCGIGLISTFSFPVSILPDVTFPRLVIIAQTSNIPLREMETEITRPMEQAVATVPGVKMIRSRIMRGADVTFVDFKWGTNMLTNEQIVNSRISQIRSELPTDMQIRVERMTPTVFPVLGLSLQSKTMSQSRLWTLAEYNLKPSLGRVPGVARVEVQGGSIPEIAVFIHPSELAAFHLSQKQVEQAISTSNTIQSVGILNRQFEMYQTMVSGLSTTTRQLGRIVVAVRNGTPIQLKQVAAIEKTVQDRTLYVTADGSEAVLLNIIRQPTGNTVSVVSGVQSALRKMRSVLPKGIKINTFYNQAILIHSAIGSVEDALVLGAALAILVLLIFLGNFRATVLTALIIPSTLLITFLLMRLCDITLNLMSLGALAVGIGLVIDDAIVVVENVFRHLSLNEDSKIAIMDASKEIANPMISSTLTTIVVFLPLSLLSGITGAFFTALALTLSIALMVSLMLALFVSPSLCTAFLKSDHGSQNHGLLFERLLRSYDKCMNYSFKHPRILSVTAGCILVCTLFLGSRLETGFMPEMDEGSFIIDYVTPNGSSLHESNRILMKIEHILSTTKGVTSFSRRTGAELGYNLREPNSGDFAVMLTTGPRPPIDTIMANVRKRIQSEVPGVDLDFSQALQDLIGDLAGAPQPIQIKLFCNHPSQIHHLAKQIASNLSKIKGVVDVKNGIVRTTPELIIHIKPLYAGRLGLTPGLVADQVNTAMYGDVVSKVLLGQQTINVRVRYPVDYRSGLRSLKSVPILTSNGNYIPLSTIATLTETQGSTEIHRENERRLLDVTAHISGRDLGSVMKNVKEMLSRQTFPPGVTAVLGGQYLSQKKAFSNLILVILLAVFLVYGVMIFQFSSFTSPTIILLIMPLALFGVTLGLWITNTQLNVSSFMGAIMLVGIVVKNGILLLDRVQKAESEGMALEDAVIQAGHVRLRPILMTTLTAILGLLPLTFGIGAGAQMQQPLAIAVIGGLTFSTLFTLIYAPLIFIIFRKFQLKHFRR